MTNFELSTIIDQICAMHNCKDCPIENECDRAVDLNDIDNMKPAERMKLVNKVMEVIKNG